MTMRARRREPRFFRPLFAAVVDICVSVFGIVAEVVPVVAAADRVDCVRSSIGLIAPPAAAGTSVVS